MLRLVFALLLIGSSASAQNDYPRLHDVVGVASNDVLNVRAGPGASTPIVGELAFDARGVEVIRAEGGWGFVNVTEGTGWASMRYLSARADGDISNNPHLVCGGTEPFWDIDVRQGQVATIKTPMNFDPGERFSVGLFQRAWSPLEKHVLQGTDNTRDLTLIVAQTYCDNGMSDNEYGFDATLVVGGSEGYVMSGCCELAD